VLHRKERALIYGNEKTALRQKVFRNNGGEKEVCAKQRGDNAHAMARCRLRGKDLTYGVRWVGVSMREKSLREGEREKF